MRRQAREVPAFCGREKLNPSPSPPASVRPCSAPVLQLPKKQFGPSPPSAHFTLRVFCLGQSYPFFYSLMQSVRSSTLTISSIHCSSLCPESAHPVTNPSRGHRLSLSKHHNNKMVILPRGISFYAIAMPVSVPFMSFSWATSRNPSFAIQQQNAFKNMSRLFGHRDIPSSQSPTSNRHFSTVRSLTSH